MACVLLGSGVLGCSVTALEERERSIAINACDEDAQCGAGRCSNGACVASDGQLSTLLFELTPTATGNALAGVSFFKLEPELAFDGGRASVSLDFAAALPLTGSVVAELRPETCASRFLRPGSTGASLPVAEDDSIPARVSFTPAVGGVGLTVSSRTAEAQPRGNGDPETPRSYGFASSLPAGRYDLQIEPYAPVEPVSAGCKYPPQLIRGLCIEGGANLALSLPLPLPTELKLSITHRDSQPLANGWMVDMVDSVSGKLISTRVPLSLPSTAGGVAAYSVVLDYLPVIEHEDCERVPKPTSSELVRLSPPPGEVAPTLLFERSALELFSPGAGRIEELPRVPSAVTVEGHVLSAQAKQPEAATLTFVGRSLQGIPAGVLASFVRTVETRDEGEFEVALLPGTYDVHVSPKAGEGTPLRTSREMSWEIAATPLRQAGRAIELADAITLEGFASVPVGGGGGARGANVIVEPSHVPSSESSVLSRALDGVQLGPRSATTVISGAEGAFRLLTDSGKFHLSVRPPEGSGFAWLVMPNLELEDETTSLELPELELPLPVVVHVNASVNEESAGAIAGARVRAFAVIDEAGAPTADLSKATLLPVAEGRINDGSLDLMVPAFLHTTPN